MGMTDITLPRLGETMEEARVTEWLVAPGAEFARGDVLMEVETDKTVVEVPALMAGRMVEHLAAVGDQVDIGQPIARVETAGGADAPADALQADTAPGQSAPADTGEADATSLTASPAKPQTPPQTRAAPTDARVEATSTGIAASPLARRKAQQAGIALDGLTGTGRRGRITAADVDAARPQGRSTTRAQVAVRAGRIVYDRFDARGTAQRPPVILLHGLFADAASWRELPRQIAAQGHDVFVPDMPGHGDSVMSLPDLDAFLRAAEGFLDAVLPDGQVLLIGHSLGAFVAAHLAARLGDRLARLILLAPVGLGARMATDFLETMTEARSPDALSRGLGWLGAGADRLSDAALAQELARATAERPTRRMLVDAVAMGGVQQIALAPVLQPIAAKTVAVFGVQDRVVAWQNAVNLPTGVAVHFAQNAGHLPQLGESALILRLLA